MKIKLILIIVTILTFNLSFSQLKEFEDFTATDLKKIAKIVDFKFENNLKGMSQKQVLTMFNIIESDSSMLKQINIDSWSVCYNSKIDNFEIYNAYYNRISRSTFDNYCKELNALMMIDGTVKTPK